MPEIHITTEGTKKLLEKLNPKKAVGPDLISTTILQEYAEELAPVLRFIFQQSLDTGIIPTDWTQANITAIYKKSSKQDPANYRPVSLTSVCCKVLEHIIFRQIMNHLDLFHILSTYQHGFRSGHSTETQLIITVDDIAKSMDSRSQIDMLILDFSKAFDTVPHLRLIEKLDHYGIRNNTKQWIKGWLTTRNQTVVVDGEVSEQVHVKSGVPQGTVLGPLMFLLYINDISNGVTSSIRLFADDCLLYRTINDEKDTESLQSDLDQLVEWSERWQMDFNPTKCNTLKLTKKKSPINRDYTMKGHTLENVNHSKYLGVTLDKNLSWNNHVNVTTKKAHGTLNFLRRNISNCSSTTKSRAYKTMVRPLLEYASSAWDPHQQKQIDQIERVQSKAARFALGQHERTASVTAMRKELEWPTLQERRFIARSCMFYKIINNLVSLPIPLYLTHQKANLRNTHQMYYNLPIMNTDIYKFSYFPRTARCWNILPLQLIQMDSIDGFKQGLLKSFEQGRMHMVQPRSLYNRPTLGSSTELQMAVY